MPYIRPQAATLTQRLAEPRRFIQVVAGPRQVGKTTLVTQVTDGLDIPTHFISADEPTLRGSGWLEEQWDIARRLANANGTRGAVLVVDEIQKLQAWSETVKRLWDEDTRAGRILRVILLGSAPLLIGRGLTESLAGRFEVLHLPHWQFTEMRAAFGWNVEQYIVYGGYPGSAPLIGDPERWMHYIRDALIETTISRDVLLISSVNKPALLRQLFDLGCRYSGQILSYTKMLGQLQDAGNTTTLAHYLDLLSGAGMVIGLQKFSGEAVRSRASSPKLQVLNTALMTAQSGRSLDEAKIDGEYWGRLVESSIGAHLVNAAMAGQFDVFYWREGSVEVDFVVRMKQRVTALEVKSGRGAAYQKGLSTFTEEFRGTHQLLIGGEGISVEDFLARPVEYWLAPL